MLVVRVVEFDRFRVITWQT